MQLLSIRPTNVAKANFYPSLTLTASAGFKSLEPSNWFSANALISPVAARLFQPILNGRKIRTRYEVVLCQKEIVLLSYKKHPYKQENRFRIHTRIIHPPPK